MMVESGDTVVMYGLVVNGTLEEDEAQVLGSEEDFVWLYSISTRKIYRHNPSYIQNHQGRKVLFGWDYCESLKDVCDEQEEPNSGVFWHASEAGRVKLTQMLKMYRLM